jgi:predicted N-acetyltransferase YhbS
MADARAEVTVRLLRQDELAEADRILRLAFGTFLGLADPMGFMGDGDYVRTRWAADPTAALAAELDGELVGTNFVTRWGSVGLFGPLSVEPSSWDRGVARALLRATMARLDAWGVAHRGLSTFPDSPKHLALYASFGFQPRFLTSILAKPVAAEPARPVTFASLEDHDRGLADAGAVAGSVFHGLDLRREIEATEAGGLGDTVMVYEGRDLAAFAV